MYRKLMAAQARDDAARKAASARGAAMSQRGLGRGLALYALASVVAIGVSPRGCSWRTTRGRSSDGRW